MHKSWSDKDSRSYYSALDMHLIILSCFYIIYDIAINISYPQNFKNLVEFHHLAAMLAYDIHKTTISKATSGVNNDTHILYLRRDEL